MLRTKTGHTGGFRITDVDRRIIALLQQNSRRTISEIAAQTGAARATVRERIELMKDAGVIRRFTIEMRDSPECEPQSSIVFLQLKLKRAVCRIVYAWISGWPEVYGCWSIAGELDMIIQLQTPNPSDIEELREKIAAHPEVREVTTVSVLRRWM